MNLDGFKLISASEVQGCGVMTYDIETIPQQSELTGAQKEYVGKRLDAFAKYENKKDVSSEEKLAWKNKIMATNPFLGEILVIGMYFPEKSGYLVLSQKNLKEEQMLTSFWSLIGGIKKIRGFNQISFDNRFVAVRSLKYNITPTNKNFMNWRKFQRYPQYDAMKILADWDNRQSPGLSIASEHVGIPSPKEGAVRAETVYENYLNGNISEIEYYCLKDVKATNTLIEEMLRYFPEY